jgi:hypothetical protein
MSGKPATVPSARWALTHEGTDLIVDCSTCGEIGRVPVEALRGKGEPTEYDAAAELFWAHPCPDHDEEDSWPAESATT